MSLKWWDDAHSSVKRHCESIVLGRTKTCDTLGGDLRREGALSHEFRDWGNLGTVSTLDNHVHIVHRWTMKTGKFKGRYWNARNTIQVFEVHCSPTLRTGLSSPNIVLWHIVIMCHGWLHLVQWWKQNFWLVLTAKFVHFWLQCEYSSNHTPYHHILYAHVNKDSPDNWQV